MSNGSTLLDIVLDLLELKAGDEVIIRGKGAFTGSNARQIGRFELADGGTVFLDEIGEMPLELQSKLLRVIQDGEFERLGSPRTIKIDVRIIAASIPAPCAPGCVSMASPDSNRASCSTGSAPPDITVTSNLTDLTKARAPRLDPIFPLSAYNQAVTRRRDALVAVG